MCGLLGTPDAGEVILAPFRGERGMTCGSYSPLSPFAAGLSVLEEWTCGSLFL